MTVSPAWNTILRLAYGLALRLITLGKKWFEEWLT